MLGASEPHCIQIHPVKRTVKQSSGISRRSIRLSMQKRPKRSPEAFLEKYKHTYPRLHKVFDQAEPSLFQFYKFPEPIRVQPLYDQPNWAAE